jgi:hypothetical protein
VHSLLTPLGCLKLDMFTFQLSHYFLSLCFDNYNLNILFMKFLISCHISNMLHYVKY